MTELPAKEETLPTGEEKAALLKRVTRDYYLSFRFSQGYYPAQVLMFSMLANMYDFQINPEDLEWLKQHVEMLKQELLKQKMPKTHFPIDQDKERVRNTFENTATVFVDVLVNDEKRKPDAAQHVPRLTRELIDSDLKYQGPPRGHLPSDPHSSYLREYVMRGQPTNSEAYDEIFSECRDYLNDLRSREPKTDDESIAKANLGFLAESWALSHPGQEFFDFSQAT